MNEVKTIVANGDIAHYWHYFTLPQCFQLPSASGASKTRLCKGNGERSSDPDIHEASLKQFII